MSTPEDPRLQPTPDYGSLGPAGGTQSSADPLKPQAARWRPLAAIAIGALLALPFIATRNVRAAWEQFAKFLTLQGKPEPASPAVLSEPEIERLDHQPPQKQAELLLERAINHYDGANDQIAARVDHWRGRGRLRFQINSPLTTALNFNDPPVPAAAIQNYFSPPKLTKKTSNFHPFL